MAEDLKKQFDEIAGLAENVFSSGRDRMTNINVFITKLGTLVNRLKAMADTGSDVEASLDSGVITLIINGAFCKIPVMGIPGMDANSPTLATLINNVGRAVKLINIDIARIKSIKCEDDGYGAVTDAVKLLDAEFKGLNIDAEKK